MRYDSNNSALARLGVLTAIVIVCLTIAVAPAPAAQAGGFASGQGETPTLTNDVGQPANGTDTGLAIGLALLVVGGVGIAAGLALAGQRRSGHSDRTHGRTASQATAPG